jgi:ligand-binding sensor domain-containing protein
MRKGFVIFFFFFFAIAHGQTGISFQKLGVEQGLHDGTVRCVGQDRFGYIWIGTVGALNRFDGKNVVKFTNIPGDSTSSYGSQPRCIHSDKKGRLWIGFETGLMEYDLAKGVFKRVQQVKGFFIGKIISVSDSILFLATRRGLIRYNTYTGDTLYYGQSDLPKHAPLKGFSANDLVRKGDRLYVATTGGLVILSLKNDEAIQVPVEGIGNLGIYTIGVDKQDNVWMGTHQQLKLIKLHAGFRKQESFDRFLTSDIFTQPLNIMGILVDSKDRKWVVTAIDGLLQYDEQRNIFIKHLHDRNIPSSPSGNNYRSIFQDDRGIIWLGCDFQGINFFEPDKFLFKTLHAFPDRLDERARGVARAVTEDKQGNIWMGNHDGVSRYNPFTGQYTFWRNDVGKPPVIYNNVVRAIYCDNENNIWIGTASGVNRFNPQTGQMEFIPATDLPFAFYNSITADRSGNIWFCNNSGSSMQWYSTTEKRFYDISEHPVLKKYAGITPTSYVLEDSRSRIWISLSRLGVLMYDKKNGKVKHYLASDTARSSIIGNQVVDIKEAKDGMVWISTFNGISGIDVERDTILSFSRLNGLPGNWVASLMVDDLNRVWAGVNGGLTMISANRKNITRFTMNDGLPSIGFSEHAGVQLGNGDFVFPSYNGYIRFNPLDYREERKRIRFYLESYSVFDKTYYPLKGGNPENKIELRANENFFTFNLSALNYINPDQTWFAYKLDGFEKEWHFTQDPKAVYTNVPGGDYTFLFKAAKGNDHWEYLVPKRVEVSLQTHFYKSAWFWSIIGLLFAGSLFAWLRSRSLQQGQMFLLESKAQLLEKEKAMVMYESLKQQLNPHFLFNSLTSLSGLIETDQQVAGEFLDQMSGIYRYILRNSSNETVSLKDEIEFVQMYITLQKTRFGNGLQVNINVSEDFGHFKIAPVTLQNLIENAIKHNIIDKSSPLVIDIFTEHDYLVVRNNLQKKGVVETSNKTGLAQFVSLYKYLSGKPVVIEETEREFVVKVPLV